MPRLGLLFVLGGLQGAVGWFMVASGFLPDTTAVSPYRLVIHLALALTLYSAIVWTGLSALYPLHCRAPVSRLLRLTYSNSTMSSSGPSTSSRNRRRAPGSCGNSTRK